MPASREFGVLVRHIRQPGSVAQGVCDSFWYLSQIVLKRFKWNPAGQRQFWRSPVLTSANRHGSPKFSPSPDFPGTSLLKNRPTPSAVSSHGEQQTPTVRSEKKGPLSGRSETKRKPTLLDRFHYFSKHPCLKSRREQM